MRITDLPDDVICNVAIDADDTTQIQKQKQIFRMVGPSLAAPLEPLAHCRNVASLSLFYRYYFGRGSSELAELVQLSCSRGRKVYLLFW